MSIRDLENQIDSTDLRILESVMEDGRVAFSTLADQLGTSNTLIHQRIKKMKDAGILTKPIYLVSPEKAGYDTCAFVLIITKESSMKNIAIILFLATAVSATAQDLRSVLLQQLKSTHNKSEWFVSANVAVEPSGRR